MLFKNKPAVQVSMHIEFNGKHGLHEEDRSDAKPQDTDPSQPGQILTGKRNGQDRDVWFEIAPAKPCKKAHTRKGDGTIKVGQSKMRKSKRL